MSSARYLNHENPVDKIKANVARQFMSISKEDFVD